LHPPGQLYIWQVSEWVAGAPVTNIRVGDQKMADKAEPHSTEKINEALKLLNEAARDSVDSFRDQAVDKYDHLRDALLGDESKVKQSLQNVKERTNEAVVRARDVSNEKVREVATQLDENVHDNPWPFVGGAAFAGLLLGYILGRK
jgi:ElaB/YqjD/DUF883 family membrane-anchored ribosome-binding protein